MPRQTAGFVQVQDNDWRHLNFVLRQLQDKVDALGGGRGIFPHEDDILIVDSTKGLVVLDDQRPPHYWRIRVNAAGTVIGEDIGKERPGTA